MIMFPLEQVHPPLLVRPRHCRNPPSERINPRACQNPATHSPTACRTPSHPTRAGQARGKDEGERGEGSGAGGRETYPEMLARIAGDKKVLKGLYEKDGSFDRVKARAEHFYFVSDPPSSFAASAVD